METRSTKQILSDLYGLMMEINFHRTDEEVLNELQENSDPDIDKHLLRIKQINAKLKAEANRIRFKKAKDQLSLLKEKGVEAIQKLITPEERAQYAPLFRKFKELTKGDEESIMEDQELLKLLETLNDHIDENSE
ncbi:MAG: hypothetical protein ACFCUM_17810 [Bacteroidales bacterium]